MTWTRPELNIFNKLSTPGKIQDFLDKLPINFEKNGDTCYSPRLVLKHNKAHCLEGAVFAAAALRLQGHKPLLVDLKADKTDDDHVIAVFKIRGRWGAISKTNHAVLRFREPVYRTIRELVMSYFHEYFTNDGRKTLRSYSLPVNLSRFDKQNWMTADKHLWFINRYLDKVRHFSILPPKISLRKADPVEIKAGKIVQYKK